MNTHSPNTGQGKKAMYADKRLGIMQPYFFPYLGYFGLIANTDRWIVFDPVQYIRKGWVNRNRVLKQGGGLKYVAVTMAPHSRETLIKDMQVAPDVDHFEQLLRQLDHYKNKRAPHYAEVVELLATCFEPRPTALVPFLTRSLDLTCAYLGIPFRAEIYSAMELDHAAATHPGEWALHISQALEVRTYINPPGGKEIFDPLQFEAAGIELLYHHQELPSYPQHTGSFEPGLSIIDVMMFNEPAAIREMLSQHTLTKA
ncbi:MAG: WbqC family protein [Flavobacteriales bacterium]|nr:WbqC family protein [Flavobacteriales bacterium]